MINISDAIWITVAFMTYEKIHSKAEKFKISDISFSIEDICARTFKIFEIECSEDDVLDVTAKQNGTAFNYLVSINKNKFRLSYMNEFSCEHECPDYDFLQSIRNQIEEKTKLEFRHLFKVINSDYSDRLSSFYEGKDIDYKYILHYITNYQNLPYSDPKKQKDDVKKNSLLEIKKNGAQGIKELAKVLAYCSEEYGLDNCDSGKWLDGSNNKVRDYLWGQLRYSEYVDSPICVSIFVSLQDRRAYYRVCLEINNKNADLTVVEAYHKHLDLPLCDNMVYVIGSNESKNLQILSESREEILEKYNNKKIKKSEKIQPSIFIESDPSKTNSDYHKEIMEAVKTLIPYYDHVIGKEVQSKMAVSSAKKRVKTVKESGKYTAFSKNTILYGPPGTGKTYNTAKYAVSICDGENAPDLNDYPAVMKRYNELMKNEGRISFVTFHQSYGYEEFIEGIKPIVDESIQDVGYKIEPGIFKKFCESAVEKKVTLDGVDRTKARVWSVLLDGTGKSDLKKECFNSEKGCIRIGWSNSPKEIEDVSQVSSKQVYDIITDFQYEMQEGDIVVTQLTNHSIDGIGIIGKYSFDDSNKAFPRKRDVDWLVTSCNIDILELNKNVKLPRKSVCALYRISADKILSLIDNDKKVEVSKEVKPYVFIIDEINRGNISKIFGELITLIEETKREGKDEATSALLPYSKERFSVPDNVYILGTMNTADRSIALMDTALRRRFDFIEMMPDVDVLRTIGADKVVDSGIELDVAKMLTCINTRIEYLYDREHTIGHAFFTGLKDEPTIAKLSSIFQKSVIPLLQEYFYEDYSKIMLVLGDNGKTDEANKFIVSDKIKTSLIFKGNTSDIDLPECSYRINYDAFNNIKSYIEIMN